MELNRSLLLGFEECKPYVLMIMSQLSLAIFMILIESLLSGDGGGTPVSPLIIVVYEHVIATFLLSFLAFFLEKNKRPPLSFRILRWAFLLGALQTILSQLMLTMSLQYIDSTFQSVALNLVPAIVFVLALIFHQEKLKFWSINGQVKILSIVISVGGALVLVLWKGPILLTSINPSNYFGESQDKAFIGSIMVIVAVLATSFANIVLGHVIKFYPAEMSLSAMMNFFGTIQTTIFSASVLSSSAWKPKWDGGLTLLTILMGGFVITGFFYYVSTWVIKKKGVVFATAFSPLLVLFSFILQTLFLGSPTHLGSIIGGFMVVLGLYLILWEKAKELKVMNRSEVDPIYSPLIQP